MTAEDFLEDYKNEYFAGEVFGEWAYKREEVLKVMKDFAKLHVQEALKSAAENVNMKIVPGAIYKGSLKIIDKDSILNSYNLDSIK